MTDGGKDTPHHGKGKAAFHDYGGFVEKFEPKRTTDDCMTPPAVYEAVRRHVDENYCPLEGHRVLRPFYPGGDYRSVAYGEGDIVLDNPPFSIISQIVRFYRESGVRFFLFAPHLTLLGLYQDGVTCVCAGAEVTYENGAKISTDFVTNLYKSDVGLLVDGKLSRAVRNAGAAKPPRKLKSWAHHPNVTSAALLGTLPKGGIILEFPRASCRKVSKVAGGKVCIFGGGLLLSDAMAREVMAREAKAREAKDSYELSEEEKEMIKKLK